MSVPSASSRPCGSDGFILVAVLWILSALAGLAAIYAAYVNETASILVGRDEDLQAQELAMAGVELAVYQLTAVANSQPSHGRLNFALGNADIAVDYVAENARIDINAAPKPLLSGLFVALGANGATADGFADRIVEWRTPLSPGTQDGEAALYRSAGKGYGPRHGPFQHVNELALLPGLPPPLLECALPFLTVYSGQAGIDVFDAAPEVLSALPGITEDRLRVLLAQRQGVSQDVLKAQLGMAAQYVTIQPSTANRITVEMQFKSNRRVRSEAVVLLMDKDREPYRMLSWRQDMEPPNDIQRPVNSTYACARNRGHADAGSSVHRPRKEVASAPTPRRISFAS